MAADISSRLPETGSDSGNSITSRGGKAGVGLGVGDGGVKGGNDNEVLLKP